MVWGPRLKYVMVRRVAFRELFPIECFVSVRI